MATRTLTQDRLKHLLCYDADTGVFTYATPRTRIRVGNVAGHTHKGHGYRQLNVDGKLYLAHRLAWLYTYGEWPSDLIDHINRDKTDNRISNLRLSDKYLNRQNCPAARNSTSGVRGVTWSHIHQKWHARISYRTVRHHVGWFLTKEDAIAARQRAEELMHAHRPV